MLAMVVKEVRVLGCPLVGIRAAAFNGDPDPASLARDNINHCDLAFAQFSLYSVTGQRLEYQVKPPLLRPTCQSCREVDHPVDNISIRSPKHVVPFQKYLRAALRVVKMSWWWHCDGYKVPKPPATCRK